MKYKILKDWHTLTFTDIDYIPAGTVGTKQNDNYYLFTSTGGNWNIPVSAVENPANSNWFEKMEEPIIKEGENYWFIDGHGEVSLSSLETRFIIEKARLEVSNIFPARLFTKAEVQSHADRIKQLNKEFQESKQ